VDGQAANFKDEKGGRYCGMGVDGCCGVHCVASLCGGRVRQISRDVLIRVNTYRAKNPMCYGENVMI